MDFTTLQAWVKEGEHHTQEFKRSTSQLKPAMQTLCAFLNAQGGRVLLGVTDEGKIVGQQIADKTQRELGQSLQQFEPHAMVEIHYVPLQNTSLQVIVLEAKPQRTDQPYLFAGRAYERQQTTTHVMSQARYEQILLSRNVRIGEWESQPALRFTLADLDQDEVFRTLQLGMAKGRIPASGATADLQDALTELGLLEEGQLLQAAIVLFARNPFLHYPQCKLRMVCFNGIEKENVVDNKQTHGHIFALIEAAMAFAHLHLPMTSHFEGIQRVDDYWFPEKVLREALINAFAHRDYSVKSGSVSFMIYTDRIEISNFGGLMPPMTIEKLKVRHQSMPRNPKIASTLYNRGMIDEHGAGTREIIRLTCEAGHPEPEFIEEDSFFTVCLRSKAPIYPGMGVPLDHAKAVLQVFKKFMKPITLPALQKELIGIMTERQLRYELDKLRKAGEITLIGRGKNAIWQLSPGIQEK
jgi:ATP-dependent DNA helicase RecG